MHSIIILLMFIYLKEIKFIVIYIFITLILSCFVSFSKLSSLIILFYYPIAKIFHTKLLILHVWDLINSSFLLSVTIGSFFSVLSFNYFLKLFFFPSWHLIQKNLIVNFFSFSFSLFLFYIFLFLFTYVITIHFLLIWNSGMFNSYKLFDIQFQIYLFLQFQIYLFFSSLLIFLLVFTFIFCLKWFLTWKNIFMWIKLFKYLFFFTFSLIMFIFFCDIFYVSLILLVFYIFLEIIFFFICFKLITFISN